MNRRTNMGNVYKFEQVPEDEEESIKWETEKKQAEENETETSEWEEEIEEKENT